MTRGFLTPGSGLDWSAPVGASQTPQSYMAPEAPVSFSASPEGFGSAALLSALPDPGGPVIAGERPGGRSRTK